MGKFLSKLGTFIVISRRHRRVRRTIVFLFSNLLFLSTLIFTVEIILIFLGVGGIAIPLPFKRDLLINLIF